MEIKRILTFLDEVRSEAGRRTEPPLRKAAVSVTRWRAAARIKAQVNSTVGADQ